MLSRGMILVSAERFRADLVRWARRVPIAEVDLIGRFACAKELTTN